MCFFHDIPQDYDEQKKNIKNIDLKELYKHINFKYFYQKQENVKIDNFICDYIKDIKFIVYDINVTLGETPLTSNGYDVVICYEKECLVIESIDIKSFVDIFKPVKSLVIDLNSKEKKYDDINQEVSSFCHHFQDEVNNNKFVKNTIRAISAYIIRRNFCQSNYFINQSFFSFSQKETKKEIEYLDYSRFDREKMFQKVQEDKSDIQIINPKTNFKESDFIVLRLLYHNSYAKFNLVIHIKSYHLFMVKKIVNFDEKYQKSINHEKEFNEHYSHRCLTPFYGFLMKDGIKIGFVYEFMSNGTLDEFFSSFKVDETFSMMTVLRLFQAIDFLHSNSLIHRDIKPSNILIDHDHVPYLSDFDTIKKVDSSLEQQEKMTVDIGSQDFISPEQLNEYYSLPTDIYSFAKIICFVFERKNIDDSTIQHFLTNESFPKVIRDIFQKCIQSNQSHRPNISRIKDMIINGLNSYFFDPIFLKNTIMCQNMQQLSYEVYYILFLLQDVTLDYLQKNEIQLFQLLNLMNKISIPKLLFLIGKVYYDDEYFIQDFQKARIYFEISSQLNNSDALNWLGRLYHLGQGVEQNFDLALKLYELSALQNNAYAISNIGLLYLKGNGVEQDLSKAVEYFKLSAQQNNECGLNNLGSMYYMGICVEQDFQKALHYFELANEVSNHPLFMNNIGNIYLRGSGVKHDYYKAKQLLEKAAKLNLPLAQCNLGLMYSKGLGVPKDYNRAKEYFEISAQKCSFSAYRLGKLYLYGLISTRPDYSKAKEYFELTAKLEYDKGFYQLGMLYKNGQGVEQNYIIAKKYYDLAASFGNSHALYQIGILYYYGHLGERDLIKAKYYFEESSNMNNLNAFFYLGTMYENGDNIPIDIGKAIENYKLCASNEKSSYISKVQLKSLEFEAKNLKNQHYHQSNNNLGMIYVINKKYRDLKLAEHHLGEAGYDIEYPYGQNNIGLFLQYYSKNLENAIHMFVRSSKHNFSLSEFNIGHIFESGGKRAESINHYIKASDYENEILLFRNQIIEDEKLDISKSFIICFTNLKIAQYYNQINDKCWKNFFLKAIFRPLFKLLFIQQSKLYRFIFKTMKINNQFIISNFKEFILNFPLFNININTENPANSCWNILENSTNDDIEIQIFVHCNEMKNSEKTNKAKSNLLINDKKEEEMNDVQCYDNEIIQIFDYMNKQNHFEIISNDEQNENRVFLFKKKGSQIKRRLKYSKHLFKILFNSFYNVQCINDIIDEINEILFKEPYSILFGRINANDNEENALLQNENKKGMNELFYEAFNE